MKRTSVNKRIDLGKKGLILCEGLTETNYFKGLVTQEKFKRKLSSVGVEIYQPKNHSPVGLVNEAKERMRLAKKEGNPFDFVWIVFDKDGHQNIPQAFSDAFDMSPKIKIAFSVTCFEFFILLHFQKTTKAFSKCDDVISDLKKYIPEYEKSNNLFEDLKDFHEIACRNGEWCIQRSQVDIDAGIKEYNLSSYTNVHELINHLETIAGLR